MLIFLIGCNRNSDNEVTPAASKLFAGRSLKIHCDSTSVGEELTRRAMPWSLRTGAKTLFEPDARGTVDILIVRPHDMGQLVTNQRTTVVPDELRSASNSLQWSRCLSVWTERLAGWGGESQGVPLAGEGYVLVYRADKFADNKTGLDFQAKYSRRLTVPRNWEEFAEVAEFFADRGAPSLPALPEEPLPALRDFHFVAACYDRQAILGTTLNRERREADDRSPSAVKMLSFHHDLESGEPRLLSPGIQEAARWSKRVARCRMPQQPGMTNDPVQSLVSGTVVLGVFSMAELGRLPRENAAAPKSIGVAPLPGSKVWYDASGAARPADDKGQGVNFVPYFGNQGWIGVVNPASTNREAAFDLLADLASLDRSSELLSDPRLGFGPFRAEHLDQGHENIWQRYGFDGEQTRILANAIRQYCGIGLANPVIGTRIPQQDELMAILAKQVTSLVYSPLAPEDALKTAFEEWQKVAARQDRSRFLAELRKSAGLQ